MYLFRKKNILRAFHMPASHFIFSATLHSFFSFPYPAPAERSPISLMFCEAIYSSFIPFIRYKIKYCAPFRIFNVVLYFESYDGSNRILRRISICYYQKKSVFVMIFPHMFGVFSWTYLIVFFIILWWAKLVIFT